MRNRVFLLGRSPSARLCSRRGLFRVSRQPLLTLPPRQTLHTLSTSSWNGGKERREQCKYWEGAKKKRGLGAVCALRMVHPGNKSIADTFLGTRWSAALPLRLLIGWELPEECIAACLWKAEATTSGALIADKVAIVLSLKKRGMEQECKKKPITLVSSLVLLLFPLLLCQPLSHPLHYSVFFHPLLSRSHRLSCNLRLLVCSTFMISRGGEPEAAIQARLALRKMSHVSLSQD